jgi:hypothetical protein
MSLYVEIQARMASWVIVQTCVRLRVLFAGASMGTGFGRMPNLAIVATNEVEVACLGSWGLGEHYASHATDSVCLLLVNLGVFILWEVPAQRDFLLCLELRWAAPLEVHTGILLGCCYRVFVVILECGAVLRVLAGPLPCLDVCCSPLRHHGRYFGGCQAI